MLHDSWKDLAHNYNHMTNDVNRNSFYSQCFGNHLNGVRNKKCVEIGFGMGVLSLLAMQHNPKHIHAFEAKKDVYEIGKYLLECSGLDQYITLENRYITPQEIANMHDVEVVYHELLSEDFWTEHAFDFMSTGKTIIPSRYTQTFWLQELDYGDMNSGTRKSQYNNFSLSTSYFNQMQFIDTVQNSCLKLKILDKTLYNDQIMCYIAAYNNLVGDVEVYKKVKNIDIITHYPTAQPIAELIFDTRNKTITIKSPDENKSLQWTPDTKLSDINFVIGKQHLPRDFAFFTTGNLGNYNNTISCKMHNCTSWAEGIAFCWNFISSRNITPQDIKISYKHNPQHKYQNIHSTSLHAELI